VACDGRFYDVDDGFRSDSSIEKLATLKPFFDKIYGRVTAGNSSQITDGAAMLLLASEEAVKKMKLPVLGRLVDIRWAGLDPTEMGLGPVHATVPLLQEQKLSLQDIDYWEINEAFAAQVLACVAALNDETYFQQAFPGIKPLGQINKEKLNIDGGAIAMGHPVGASGARLVLHLLHILKRNHAKRGIATLCIGGGQGGAILVETVS
jgi:acetyl-CoA C-acetyltransferase